MAIIVLVFALLIAVLIVGLVVAHRNERERLRRIARWAADHGWAIVQDPAVDWSCQLPGGRGARVPLLVHAWLGDFTVGVADYTYTTVTHSNNANGGTSTTTVTHALLVTAIRLPQRLPAIAVVRRGALSRLGRAMFGDGASATGNAEFDRRFRIRTRHPDLAHALVGPALIAEHLAESIPTWSLADHDLLTWQAGRISDPAQIPALVEPLMRVARLLATTPR
jgi:hypothetical protein